MASEEPPHVDIIVPPEHMTGVYANFAAVSSQTPHDVTLDFIQVVPGVPQPSPVVVARLKLAPSFLMPLMQVLSSHLSTHEAIQRQMESGPPTPPSTAEEEPNGS